MASSVSPPCSGSDVSYCVKNCCVPDIAVSSRTCASCYFLCRQEQDVATLSESCRPFCRLALRSQDEITITTTTTTTIINNSLNSQRNLEVVVYILAVLVAILAIITTVFIVAWCRRCVWGGRNQKGAVCEKCKEMSGVTANQESRLKELTVCRNGHPGGDTESDLPKTEKCPLNRQEIHHHRLDMDAGSLCEALSEDEFHDAWSPGTTPVPSRVDTLRV